MFKYLLCFIFTDSVFLLGTADLVKWMKWVQLNPNGSKILQMDFSHLFPYDFTAHVVLFNIFFQKSHIS